MGLKKSVLVMVVILLAVFFCPVNASASAVASLSLTVPDSVTWGQAFTITITARDGSGNMATDYTGTVHFTSIDSSAVLPGDYTFNATDNGVHSFSVTLYTNGSSLTITDSGGVAGYWKMDEASGTTAADFSGRGNSAILTSSSSWSSSHPDTAFTNTACLSLDGSDYAYTSQVPSSVADNFTLSAWVNWSGSSNGKGYQFIAYNGNSTANGYGIYADNSGTLGVMCGCSGFVTTSATLTANTWQHVAAVRSNGQWYIYLDGSSVAITGGTTLALYGIPAGSLYIGTDSASALDTFIGLVDDVRVYDLGLSAAEISSVAMQANDLLIQNTWSNITVNSTVPGKPTNVLAGYGNAQATVTFTAGSDGGSPITSYTVTSSGGQTATGTSSPITITGLSNGTAYTFMVTATNENGTSEASAASVIPRADASGMMSDLRFDGGYWHSVLIETDGTAETWGYNGHGQLGDGTSISHYVPVSVNALKGTTIKSVSAGWGHTLALATDGSVWAWGYNIYGQLGNNNTSNSSTPVQVSGLSGKTITAVAGGLGHSLALDSDGNVWTWGANYSGQLGDGSTDRSGIPVKVSDLSGNTIIAIAAGYDHSLALDTNGNVWTWGYNNTGQLGNNSTTGSNLPVQVTYLSGKTITAIAAGSHHSLALASDGTVWAWGGNFKGQLGIGNTINSSIPVQVSALSGNTITAIAAGAGHNLALNNYGQVWAWGYNYNGQIGDGTANDRYSPVQISALSGKTISAIAAGSSHSLAMNITGQVWAWGNNSQGQVGDGTLSTRYTPVLVPGCAVMQTSELTELNLDGAQLTINLYRCSFSSSLTTGQFILNNAPTGAGIAGVNRISSTQCVLTLQFDGTQLNNDINNFYVTIDGTAISGGYSVNTNTMTIMGGQVGIMTDQALTENNLNGLVLTVQLNKDCFVDAELEQSNFILNNAPAGLSIGGIFYVDAAHCTIGLSYDNSDINNDISDFGFTIKGIELSSGQDASRGRLTITAAADLSISTGSLAAGTVGTAYSSFMQVAGGSGPYTWSAAGLPAWADLNSTSGEITGTPSVSGSTEVAFTVYDVHNHSASLTLIIAVGNAKYTLTPFAEDSIYDIGTDNGIPTMTVKSEVTGLKYFRVSVSPVISHVGEESIVFVLLRNGVQVNMSISEADFDSVNKAGAGFNVRAGDVIKAYIYDSVSNDNSFNPTLLM